MLLGGYAEEGKKSIPLKRILAWAAVIGGTVAFACFRPLKGNGSTPTNSGQAATVQHADASQPPPEVQDESPVQAQNGNPSDNVTDPTNDSDSNAVNSSTANSPTNCYDNQSFRNSPFETGMNISWKTREEFSQKIASAQYVAEYDITVLPAGDDSQYLLFVTDPGNTSSLMQLAMFMKNSDSIRANLCIQGFAEAQFIVRDENMQQTLLMKLPTNVNQAVHYLGQHDMATPMN